MLSFVKFSLINMFMVSVLDSNLCNDVLHLLICILNELELNKFHHSELSFLYVLNLVCQCLVLYQGSIGFRK